MLDLATRRGSRLPAGELPWQYSGNVPLLPGDAGLPTLAGGSGTLTVHDVPDYTLPVAGVAPQTIRIQNADVPLTRVDIVWNFTIFIAGMTTDQTATEGITYPQAVYTAFDSGTWVFNGTGTMNNGVWSPIAAAPNAPPQTGTGDFTTADFADGTPTAAATGMQVRKPTFNGVLHRSAWGAG
jgi:hypothetical protein